MAGGVIMALKIYADAGFTQPLRTILAMLNGDGATNTFAVSEEPDEVRLFGAGKPYGELLVKNTTTPTTPSAGEWGYSGGTVYLGNAPAVGETVVAFSGGVRIFEGVNTVSGQVKFLSSSDDVNDRTKIQQLWIKNDAVDREYTEVSVVSIIDLVAGEGADVSWFSVAPDNAGSPGTWQATPLNLANIGASGSVSFWLKCVVPKDTPVENLRDIYITVRAIESSTN